MLVLRERGEEEARRRKESDRCLWGRENNEVDLRLMASAAMTAVVQWKACSRCRWTFMLLYLFDCACEREEARSERARSLC